MDRKKEIEEISEEKILQTYCGQTILLYKNILFKSEYTKCYKVRKRALVNKCIVKSEATIHISLLLSYHTETIKYVFIMGFRRNLCENVSLPEALPWTTACSSILLCMVTVPGNVLILIAVVKDPYNNLRTNFNCLVINLVVSDLLLGLVTEPMFVV